VKLDDGSVRIELLRPGHNRLAFTCGNSSLDRYIREQATQDMRRSVARVFVATLVDSPDHILGFYTLSAAWVTASELPPDVARRLPRHPIPAALIGRLAVDRNFARRGLGGILLADAIQKTMVASQIVAITVVIVDPLDDAAKAFYSSFGFRNLDGPQQRMFMTIAAGAARLGTRSGPA